MAKYNNTRTTYNGYRYDSAREAKYASELDLSIRAGRVVEWIRQPAFVLVEGFVYHADFLVIELINGQQKAYAVDVKGPPTQRFRDVLRLWKAHARIPLLVVYSDRHELIEPGEENTKDEPRYTLH